LRQHFCNVYAYCRWADDLGDEVASPLRALELLDDWERELDRCYAGRPSHPVFIALAPTITAFDIPADPFRDLLKAFRQDQTVRRYETWADLLDYCRYSANPVGRLVLYLCGYRDAERQRMSDSTCTALQLANFWQDVSRDLDKDRIYIPLETLHRHNLTPEEVEARHFDQRYAELMQELIHRTRALFAEGDLLQKTVDARLRVDLDLFGRGGMAILDAIERQGYNTLQTRPSIGTMQRLSLLSRAVSATAIAPFSPDDGASHKPSANNDASASSATTHAIAGVDASYEECRRVAREAASNFYYAFFMLPRPKRDALCALYAFMRLVDDVSDDDAATARTGEKLAARRAGLTRWRALLDQAVAGEVSWHPILPAFADTVRRYQIPPRYFHDLISGAEMDLTETRYATFERLQEYCYRVAGTVGLTCLSVFGTENTHAPELAERLGIAFQLTNILRDVRGDLEMGRVYLPAEDLRRCGVSEDDLASGIVTPQIRELLRMQAERAWRLYAEGAQLVGRIHTDSRAALWALIRIYGSLLARIEERDFDVFSSRVRLTTAEKTGVLLRARLGFWSETDALEERHGDRRRAGGTFFRRRAG
jgi:phytoene synthase